MALHDVNDRSILVLSMKMVVIPLRGISPERKLHAGALRETPAATKGIQPIAERDLFYANRTHHKTNRSCMRCNGGRLRPNGDR